MRYDICANEELVVYDPDNGIHRFTVGCLALEGCLLLMANEADGFYSFELISDQDESRETALKRLYQKVIDGIEKKSLHLNQGGRRIENAVRRGEYQYTLQDVGVLRVVEGEEGIGFVIDGQCFGGTEVVKMLTAFQGFDLQFQVRSRSEDVLKRNQTMAAVDLGRAVIWNKFLRVLNWFIEDGTSNKVTRAWACEEALEEVTDHLRILWQYGRHREARELGLEMKRHLLELKWGDAGSPVHVISEIDSIVKREL